MTPPPGANSPGPALRGAGADRRTVDVPSLFVSLLFRTDLHVRRSPSDSLHFLALLAACGGSEPSGPSTGSLALAVVGLPAGTSAAVTVTGPGGYSHLTEGSETLSGLMPGAYTLAAEPVSGNGQNYQPAQSFQSVTVAEGATAATAQITYGAAGAGFTLTISGLPPGVAASVRVTGPNGYDSPVTATTTLSGLEAGVYTVAAQSVSSPGTEYDPSPGTQSVNITDGGGASASVDYTQAASAGLNLRIDGLYLTQSVQTYTGAVPLVKDRGGFLRVFVTATQSNLAAPSVRVRFAVSGVVTKDTVLGRQRPVGAAFAGPGQPRRLVEHAGARSPHSAGPDDSGRSRSGQHRGRDQRVGQRSSRRGARRWRWTCALPRPSPCASCRSCRPSTVSRATSTTPTWRVTSPRRCGCIRWPRMTPTCERRSAPTRPPWTPTAAPPGPRS